MSSNQVSGKVAYNGHEMQEFVPQRTSAYISQYDLHIPEMTVRETLTFSARCQGVGTRFGKKSISHVWSLEMSIIFALWYVDAELLKELSRREKEANIKPDPDVDIFMKVKLIFFPAICFAWSSESNESPLNIIIH